MREAGVIFYLIVTGVFSISGAAQSRTCLWAPAGISEVKGLLVNTGQVHGSHRTARDLSEIAGRLEATTVRAFLVSV